MKSKRLQLVVLLICAAGATLLFVSMLTERLVEEAVLPSVSVGQNGVIMKEEFLEVPKKHPTRHKNEGKPSFGFKSFSIQDCLDVGNTLVSKPGSQWTQEDYLPLMKDSVSASSFATMIPEYGIIKAVQEGNPAVCQVTRESMEMDPERRIEEDCLVFYKVLAPAKALFFDRIDYDRFATLTVSNPPEVRDYMLTFFRAAERHDPKLCDELKGHPLGTFICQVCADRNQSLPGSQNLRGVYLTTLAVCSGGAEEDIERITEGYPQFMMDLLRGNYKACDEWFLNRWRYVCLGRFDRLTP